MVAVALRVSKKPKPNSTSLAGVGGEVRLDCYASRTFSRRAN